MSLTQQNINEAGEAFNDALRFGVLTQLLRNDLVTDLYSPTHAFGDLRLVAAARMVRSDTRTRPAYFGSLDAYLGELGVAVAPVPVPAPTPVPAPIPSATPQNSARFHNLDVEGTLVIGGLTLQQTIDAAFQRRGL